MRSAKDDKRGKGWGKGGLHMFSFFGVLVKGRFRLSMDYEEAQGVVLFCEGGNRFGGAI